MDNKDIALDWLDWVKDPLTGRRALKDMEGIIHKEIIKRDKMALADKIAMNNRLYLNKCYKILDYFKEGKALYYKVISGKAMNENRVSILGFPEEPMYEFNSFCSMNYSVLSGVVGKFEEKFIYLYDMSIEILEDKEKSIPISIEEFNTAMDRFIYKLQNMEFKEFKE